MIPSEIRIEISVNGITYVLLGVKGLKYFSLTRMKSMASLNQNANEAESNEIIILKVG